VKKNTVIENRETGETLTMLISEEDNAGGMQLYRVHLPAHRPTPPLHYHIAFAETFTALEGTLDMYIGRERKHVLLNVGESVTVPAYQPHTFANNSGLSCTMTVETRPAGGVVKAFQLAYGIANKGGAAKDSLPKNPLIRLRFIGISQGFLPSLPLIFQQTIFSIAALVSKITGVERQLERFLE
jgi:mannose-6-phosphate isomerase-like protein (cupin superfamily)